MRSSDVFHTSTSCCSSVVFRAGSGVATCSLIPKNTRLLSSLQDSVPRSLITEPDGNPADLLRVEQHLRHGNVHVAVGDAGDVRECEQHVVALPHLVDVDALENGQRRVPFIPREPVVNLRIIVERRRSPVAGVENEDAVAVLHRGVNGVGDEIPLLVEGDVTDAAE